MKTEWLSRQLLVCPHYCLCLSQQEFKKAMDYFEIDKEVRPQFFVTPGKDATVFRFSMGKVHVSIVCVKGWEKQKPVEVYGLLIHEAVHIWQDIVERMGEREPGVEIEAYSIQWIAQQLINDFMTRKRKKVKRR